MKSQFNVEQDLGSATRESRDVSSSFRENMQVRFANDVRAVIGEAGEPDTLFFIETWTLGVSAAVENWEQRRQNRADRQSSRRGTFDFASVGFVVAEDSESIPDSKASADAAAIRDNRGTSRSTVYTVPHFEKSREQESCAEAWNDSRDAKEPMTHHRACLLLGVNPASTQKNIKDAYRQKARQWHPDRLENRSTELSQIATEQMAAINEAYRFLHQSQL